MQFSFNSIFSRLAYLGAILLIGIGAVSDVAAQKESRGSFRTVVLDPGHGGKDPGALGKTAKEKDIVLAVALKVGEYLKKEMPDLNLVYTRNTDVFVPLDERAEIANKAKADLFVSIHANWISNPKIQGTETFVLGLHRSEENLEVAKKENSVIILEDDYSTKYEGFDPNQTESYIIFELMQNVYLDQSIEAASAIQQQFEKRVGRHNRGVKQAGFLVLRKTAMPGILVELGFLSNQDEEKFMMSEEGQTYLASAIFRAIRDYKNRFEARSNVNVNGVDSGKGQSAKGQDRAQQGKGQDKGQTASGKEQTSTSTQSQATGQPLTSAVAQSADKGKAESATTATVQAPSTDKIEFRIQVAASTTRIKEGTGPYKLFKEVWEYKEGNIYKYTTGYSTTYDQIAAQLPEVRKVVPDSFIIGFKNGEKVPVSSLRQ
jgi:N-acetylmuramoyl-L-alanine amidase